MKRILVALDASPRTAAVLEAACDLSTRLGAKLVLFRSIGLPTHIDESAVVHPREPLLDSLQHDAERELATLASRCPPEAIDKTMVHVGIPWESICSAAKQLDADLIVIGSHGVRGLDHVLGTTAAKVVNHADRNVLVVRQR